MTIEANKQAQTTGTQQSARTDDLLASGANPEDGARGFGADAKPEALQTGMEGIAGTTTQQGNRQSESHITGTTNQTLPDNVSQVGNKQGS